MVKIYIDAGHGGSDPGALRDFLKEKDLTLKLALKLKAYLERFEDVEVKLNRYGDETQSLEFRTNDANAWNADLYVSIHINAGGGTGFESYRHTSQDANSRTGQIQAMIHGCIMDKMRVLGVRDRGIKSANFHVLRETHMASLLSENLFIDGDFNELQKENYLDDLALGHSDGIEKAFNLKRKPELQPSQPQPSGTIYKVQVGAFSNKSNADRLVEELRSKGYSPVVVQG